MTTFAIANESIFQDRRLSGADIRLLLAILSHTRPNKHYCWPSRARLAELIGIKSHSRVSEILARLVSYGWVSIKRTGRSSLYTVHTPNTTSDVHPIQDIEDISEIFEKRTPYPLSQAQSNTPDPEAVQPTATTKEKSNQEERLAKSAHWEAVQPTESTAVEEKDQEEQLAKSAHWEAIQPTESAPARKPRQTPEQRQADVQRVLEAFKRTSGIDYSNRPATERRIARRVERYGLAFVLSVITAKAQDFNHPIVLLKPSILESVGAEIERDRQEAQKRTESTQNVTTERRRILDEGTREVARANLAIMKAILRGGSKS